MATTMEDVARRAKVSKATVSRVFRKPQYISDGTIERVKKIAGELGYMPPSRNKRDTQNKTKSIMIGFGMSFRRHITENPTIIEIIHGIENEARDNDVMVSIRSLGYKLDCPANSEIDVIDELTDGRADGMIVLGHAPVELFDSLNARNIPFVAVEAANGHSQVNVVMPDHYTAGYLPTKYLLDLGHRKIAYAGTPSIFHSIDLQTLAYHDAMGEFSDSCKMVIETDMSDFEKLMTGQCVAQRILNMKDKPSAVIFSGENPAADALREFQKNGFSVPEDINIIASGSTAMPICKRTNPMLTNICCVSDEWVGRMAVRRISEVIQGDGQFTQKIVLPVKLVEGKSTSAYKA